MTRRVDMAGGGRRELDQRISDDAAIPPTLPNEDAHATSPVAAGRRALISSAMDGMNRFKQSWISVMLLKAGIGLGQVAALITLLVLSCILPSPLDRSRTQVQPSPQCPHPRYFRAWIWVQIVRLVTCWAVSCWMVVRAEQARRARGRRLSAEDGLDEAVQGSTSEPASGVVGHAGTRQSEEEGFEHPGLSDSTTTTPASEYPPILPIEAVRISPGHEAMHLHSNGASGSPSDIMVASDGVEGGMTRNRYGSSSVLLDAKTNEDCIETTEKGEAQLPRLARLPIVSHRSNQSLRGARRMAQQRLHPEAPIPASPARSDIDEAEALEAPVGGSGGSAPKSWKARAAVVFDRYALKISRCLGVISLILFILGNVLLFHPPPSADTCYGASPLLWWGVMLVVGIGYILFAQIFFVVIVVGLGGAVVLDALRRIGLLPAPPAPEPPRPPQPDPLTLAQVACIPVLSYIPCTSTSASASCTLATEKDLTAVHLDAAPLETPACEENNATSYDVSRLPYPPICLPLYSSQSTCVICQEGYVPPREERAILLVVDRLKKLACGHVYHMDCIDEWLLKGSASCPACNSPVVVHTLSSSPHEVAGNGGKGGSRRGSARLASIAGGDERRRSSVISALRRVTRTG